MLDTATPEVLKKIGAHLRELRIKKGYTNYEVFSYEAGISRIQYGKYENGGDMRLSSLLKVLRALETDLVTFFAEIDFKEN